MDPGGDGLEVIVGEVTENDVALVGESEEGPKVTPDVADPAFLCELRLCPCGVHKSPLEVCPTDEEQTGIEPGYVQGPAPAFGHRCRAGVLVGRDDQAYAHASG